MPRGRCEFFWHLTLGGGQAVDLEIYLIPILAGERDPSLSGPKSIFAAWEELTN